VDRPGDVLAATWPWPIGGSSELCSPPPNWPSGSACSSGSPPRLAALGALVLIGPIWLMLLHTNTYLWEYALDLFPLLLLAIVPAGRTAELDHTLAARFEHRWPF